MKQSKTKTKGQKKLWEVSDFSSILIVMMVSLVFAYVQFIKLYTFSIFRFLIHQLCFDKAICMFPSSKLFHIFHSSYTERDSQIYITNLKFFFELQTHISNCILDIWTWISNEYLIELIMPQTCSSHNHILVGR
uniref:Uncharacterized protein n=1 Tax=Rousettus aegyptiacus TaxID=9407 RepID=A0A7J8JHC7_ROUAE|nr:hypothetical protein HJG63_010338 [Rousettus aegyptiacus]